MREQLSQFGPGFEQLRFRSARGDSELLSDLAVRIAFNVVKHEYRSSPWRQLAHRLLYRFGHKSPIAIVFRHRGVVLDVDFELREPPDLSERVESAVDGNSMSPRSELRITPVAWKRP